jgi:hypothetical protein
VKRSEGESVCCRKVRGRLVLLVSVSVGMDEMNQQSKVATKSSSVFCYQVSSPVEYTFPCRMIYPRCCDVRPLLESTQIPHNFLSNIE